MTELAQHGLYFEEFREGATFNTRGRTVTETDIVNFAGVTGDYNPMHIDAEYAKSTMFGERIAHGALGFSIAIGQAFQLGFLVGTIIAFLETNWKFRAPIKIGDTVHVEAVVTSLRDAPKMGGGLVVTSMKLINQRGEITQKGDMTFLMMHRPAAESTESTKVEQGAEA
jgi:acyl dehydratase